MDNLNEGDNGGNQLCLCKGNNRPTNTETDGRGPQVVWDYEGSGLHLADYCAGFFGSCSAEGCAGRLVKAIVIWININ